MFIKSLITRYYLPIRDIQVYTYIGTTKRNNRSLFCFVAVGLNDQRYLYQITAVVVVFTSLRVKRRQYPVHAHAELQVL